MNKYITIISILAASFTFSGCSVWDLKYGKEKPKITYSYLTQEGKTNGLHAWNPDTSAAVSMAKNLRDSKGEIVSYEKITIDKLDKKGRQTADSTKITEQIYLYEQKTCVMSAAAIKARDSESGLTIKVNPVNGTETSANFGAVTRELQKITMLQSKNEAATFLDVAFFGICMASMNDSIDKTEVKTLMSTAITSAAAIANGVEKSIDEVSSSSADLGLSISTIVIGKPITNPVSSGIADLGLTNETKAIESRQ